MKNNLNGTKYGIVTSSQFNKQLRKARKQNKDIEKLNIIVKKLANGEKLDKKYKDHSLSDTKFYKDCRECHITPDWLLVYKIINNELILYLVETGSHADLFNM